jgi:hypothetical protein
VCSLCRVMRLSALSEHRDYYLAVGTTTTTTTSRRGKRQRAKRKTAAAGPLLRGARIAVAGRVSRRQGAAGHAGGQGCLVGVIPMRARGVHAAHVSMSMSMPMAHAQPMPIHVHVPVSMCPCVHVSRRGSLSLAVRNGLLAVLAALARRLCLCLRLRLRRCGMAPLSQPRSQQVAHCARCERQVAHGAAAGGRCGRVGRWACGRVGVGAAAADGAVAGVAVRTLQPGSARSHSLFIASACPAAHPC